MSYLEKRQNPLSETPLHETEEALARIAYYFQDSWLQDEKGKHPLQLLWNRRDALATNELFTFGKSLIASEQASADWLTGQLRLVRGKDENNRKGAIFEILAVGYASSKQLVIPAPANQPGYDIDIETPQGTCYRVSLKRYSQSTHEKLFLKKAAHAETLFLKGLKASRRNAQIYVEARGYPTESDWQTLYQEAYRLGATFTGNKDINEIANRWLVGLLPLLPEDNEQYWANNVSHTFICTSPFHRNEQNNFVSKLESAVSNLERHVSPSTDKVPIILMLIPASASASILTSWVNECLLANGCDSLAAVFFLQPYTASKSDMSSSHIAYFVSAATSNSFHSKAKQRLVMQVPVGSITNQPPEWKLISDIGQRNLSSHYIYQRGKHYTLATNDSSGAISGNIKRKAPGIETITVLNINGESVILGGRWGEELCLIGE